DSHDVRRGWRRLIATRTAEYGANAGYKLSGIKRLGQIIVGANFQANDAVDVFSPCSQQKYRKARGGANAAQDFETVDAGQHYVEDHQQVAAAGGALQPAFTIMSGFHDKALGLQVFSHQSTELDVIVDDQNAFHISGFHCAPTEPGLG